MNLLELRRSLIYVLFKWGLIEATRTEPEWASNQSHSLAKYKIQNTNRETIALANPSIGRIQLPFLGSTSLWFMGIICVKVCVAYLIFTTVG